MNHLNSLKLTLLLICFWGVQSAFAATITVTNGNNTGTGSLRNAISSAASGDIIVFSGVTTVTLTSGELLVDKNLTINGGSGVTITRGSGSFRIFHISNNATVSMSNLTVSNGTNSVSGGAYQNDLGCSLTLTACVLTGNSSSSQGGSIENDANLTMINCTITNSTAPGLGGAIVAFGPGLSTFTGCTFSNITSNQGLGAVETRGSDADISLTNCTFSGNTNSALLLASNSTVNTITNCTFTNNGTGLTAATTGITLKNCIIADNNADIGGGNVSSSSSYNLIGTGGSGGLINGVNNNQVGVANPGLLALADNGGPTQTHALSPCSPAVNTGTNSGAPSTDQRGSTRPYNNGVSDIGAYELQSAPNSNISIVMNVTNVSCSGGNNGSIDLTVTGGTTPYTYAWSGSGSGTDPRTNLVAGTYTVTVTDAGNCTATNSATVTQPSAISITRTITNVTCNGGNNGSIDLTVTGGTGAYSYTWSGVGSGTDPRTNLAAGTYTVTVSDANNCTATNTSTVTQPSAISITRTITNVTCNGGNNGIIDLSVTGGTGAYSYAWSGVGTGTDPRTNLAAGTYTVTVSDANNCTATNTSTVTQPNAIAITPTVTNVSCNGGTNGSIDLSVTGGTGAYSYTWSGAGSGTDPRTNLAAGSYTVTVSDINNCTATNTSTVSQPNAIAITPTVTNSSCNGSDGSISLSVSGGTPSYTYAWTGTGTGSNPRTNLAAGTYTVTVTDNANCTSSSTSTVTAPDAVPPSISCPTNATVAAGSNCTASLASYTAAATATDNCTANPTKTQSPAPGTSLSLGAHIVTLTATDASGNTGTCSFSVTVTDQTGPTINCPTNATVAAGANCTATLASYTAAATATDNCTANPTKTQSPAVGTTLSLGAQIVTLTATDAAGNTGACTFTVTVADQTAPSINCPQNSTVNGDANGNYTLANFTTSATATDNCTANPTKTQSPAVGTILPLGMHLITLTATDGAGLTANCSFTLTVQPGCAAPTVSCPSNQTVAAGASCTASLADYTSLAQVTGGCGSSTLTQSPSAGTVLNLGTYTVTITATDAASNTGSCTFSVTVTDQTGPSISCPTNATVAAGSNCTASLASYTAAATATDNCTANPTKTQSPAVGTSLSLGAQIVTLTATDAAGNTGVCTFSVTVTDQTGPSISCPTNATVAAGSNCTATLASYTAAATATDNCTANPTKTQSPAVGTTLSLGAQIVTLTATDAAGNTGACTFSVTVTDQTGPSINCPANATVAAGANCTASLASYTAAATATDNCTANPTKTQSPAVGTIITGAQIVTLTATDAAGNTGVCSFTVTVDDQTAPSISCPTNATVAAGANCTATLASYTAAATATDNCTANPTKTQSPAAGTIITGTQIVTLTATDAAGNTGVCSFTVTVDDQTAPSISCPTNATVAAGANCTATLASYTAAATATDNCTANPTKTQSPAAGTIITGTQIVTLTATDAAGNTGVCSFTVTVADQTAPSISCPTNATVAAGANCTATLASYTAAATATDNCTANPTKTQSPAAGTIITGTQIVTLTATDAAGNTGVCSFTVTVADQTAPSISCPTNATVAAGANCTATLASYTAAATATDNCTANPTKTQSPAAGTSLSLGTQIVTLTATDAAGNTGVCSFSVTVVDQTAPSISCPTNATVAAGANCTATLASYTAAATATDNCTANPTKTQSPAAGTIITGTQIVTLTATDAAGNTGVCSFSVTVADQTAPSISCPTNATVAAGANCTATLASYTAAATATDNCTANPTKTQSPAAGTIITGTQIVTLTATDAAGNTGVCSFSVTVVDQSAPSISCPTNATVAAGANCTATLASYTAAATATDNCTANPTKTQSPAPGTSLSLGTQIVTLTATDAAGNTGVCSFSVTVADQTAPSISCPTNATVAAGANCTATLASYTAAATATDNCTANPTKTQSPAVGTTITGTQIVTLTATDAAGNTGVCSFSVTVVDQTAPSISCPSNATVAAGANCTATLASYTAAATATDNCTANPTKTQSPAAGTSLSLGTQIVTLTATDAAGNTGVCSFSVTVADQTAPSISCPANATIAVGSNCTAPLPNYATTATATDNCTANPTKTQSPAAGTILTTGTQIVTLTATDAAGNTGSCSFSVTIADQTPPTLICQNPTIFLDANGNATLSVSQVNGGSFDNCGIAMLNLSKTTFNCSNIGPNSVLLSGDDINGNKGTCTATVTVFDPIAPVAKCKNTTVQLPASGTIAVAPSTINNGSSDNCTFTLSLTPGTFTCSNVGTNIVVLKATDASGNTSTCTAVVTVQDNNGPVAKCKNLTVYLDDLGQASITAADVNNGSFDPCGISSMTIDNNTFNCGDIGVTPQYVWLTVKDVYNNTSTCVSLVSVKDGIAPTAVCSNTTVQLSALGKVTVSPSILASESFDNCSVWSYSPVAKVYTTANIGVNYLTITVKDWSNNAATCVSEVTVLPYTPPGPSGQSTGGQADELSGIADASLALSIYPNPADQTLMLAFLLPQDQQVRIRLLDTTGKLVLNDQLDGLEGENALPIDLYDLPSGLYILDIQSGTQREQKRLVVQH